MAIVTYSRVSPTKKRSVVVHGNEIAFSIHNQQERCRKQSIADSETIFKEYVDEYISGKAQEYMKDFNNLITDVKSGLLQQHHVTKVYCLRVDRFGRNAQEMLTAEKILKDYNIHIKFVEQGFDTSTSMGKLIMTVLSGFAEWQREKIITDTKSGREFAYQNNPEKFGRPVTEIDWDRVQKLLAMKDNDGKSMTWTAIARIISISTATLIKHYRLKYGDLPKRRA
jgi:site-specific DNA recombinase|tara:strand:+ start:56 stop:730 length:675 start_codon:yes stop_codon:yes gene_type:complete